eukprot:2641183-Rhodomonas_salina.3
MLRGRDPTLTLPPMLAPMMGGSLLMDPKLQQLSPPPHGPFPILMPLNNLNHQHSSQVSMVTAPLAAAAPLHQQMGSAN